MDCIEIKGGQSLAGDVRIQGSKNAALPIIAGAILHKGITILHNCPRIQDVVYMTEILEKMGCKTFWNEHTLWIDAGDLREPEVPKELGGSMRSSVIFLGALLGRSGIAKIPYPGGCSIGARPIDIHLEALGQMGARIRESEGILEGEAFHLEGTVYTLRVPSVGATENIILAAVLAHGTTEIRNSAREPEIEALCEFLNGKGARIAGAGTKTIIIEGVQGLKESEYTLPSDRIVGGTYLYGILANRGKCFLRGAPARQMESSLLAAMEMGAEIREEKEGVFVNAGRASRPLAYLHTAPYPGFPTDLQSQLMSVLCLAQGNSQVEEGIFESRFRMVEELSKMGANIVLRGQKACISGVEELYGTVVKATELRGGAALVIAGTAAKGKTRVEACHYICRGYEDICEDFRQMGADVSWCS